MDKKILVLVTAGLLTASSAALARNTILHLPLADVLAMPEAQGLLDPAVRIYLQGAAHPAVKKQLGIAKTNRKSNSFGRPDDQACRRAALSALLSLARGAQAHGANAVVNVVSYYRKQPFGSPTEYECHAGGLIAGVALKGDYAMVAR